MTLANNRSEGRFAMSELEENVMPITLLITFIAYFFVHMGGFTWQGWPRDESTCLPPMWPWFNLRTQCHKWIQFVGSLLCSERSSPSSKANI